MQNFNMIFVDIKLKAKGNQRWENNEAATADLSSESANCLAVMLILWLQ